MIGNMTIEERQSRVLRYWEKKRSKTSDKKYIYSKKKKIADKKLRINGKFVSKKQAIL